MELSAKELVDHLNNFGNKEEVAMFLCNQNVKGYREEPTECPIATWLERELDEGVTVEDVITVYAIDGNTTYKISPTVSQFITAFDLGYFPELDWDEQ